MSHTDMGIVGATTDTFILFENGVRRNRLVLPANEPRRAPWCFPVLDTVLQSE
jgi:hypothetical protein